MGRVSYKKPRKFNFVTFLLLLLLAAAAYVAIKFGPPYYRKWKAKGPLSTAANSVYPKRNFPEESLQAFFDKLKGQVTAELRAIGITDPGLKVYVNMNRAGKEVTVTADYQEHITHPFYGTMSLRFRPYNKASLTSVLE
jgi:hypothetical protein